MAGLGHLISLPKPRSLPLPGAIRPGDGSPLGNEQEAEGWRRGGVMGGELKNGEGYSALMHTKRSPFPR